MGIFDAIGNALSTVTDVVSDNISLMVDVATLDFEGAMEDVGSLMGHVNDTFEAVTDGLGPLGDVLKDALGSLTSGLSLGSLLNSALDSLGLPDWVGDIAGGVLDFCTGNYVGAIANGLDALEDLAGACGSDELAGFLKAGSEITGMFAGPMGGANPSQLSNLVGSAGNTLSCIEGSIGGAEALLSGDIAGAGSAIIECLGEDVAGVAELLGPLSAEVEGVLGEVLPQTGDFVSTLFDAMQAGGQDISAFENLPIADLSTLLDFDFGAITGPMGVPNGQMNDFFSSIIPAAGDFFSAAQQAVETLNDGGILQDLPFIGDLLNSVIEQLGDVLGFDPDDLAKLAERALNIGNFVELGVSDPDALGILHDLFAQAPTSDDALEMVLHQTGNLRA